MKNIAFIPAKTSSLRVPKKNYKLLNDKMLIDYTIELAVECDLIDEVVISSNGKILSNIKSKKIQYHLRKGAEANPKISVVELMNLWKNNNFIEGNNLILLQPTHPFRKKFYLKDSISFFQENNEFESLITVTNRKIKHINTDKNVVSLECDVVQSNKFINGQIYIFRLSKNGKIIFGKNTFMYEIPDSEYNINIDEPHDFRLAELLSKNFTPN